MSDQADPKTRDDQAGEQARGDRAEAVVPRDAAAPQETPESVEPDAAGATAASPEPVDPDATGPLDDAGVPADQRNDPDVFSWHPEYSGQHARQVTEDLARQIASDQRQHALAMDGAEEAEHDALVSVVELERKWGVYDFDWADQDADALATRIVAFELERERRQEMISWAVYRADAPVAPLNDAGEPAASELSTGIKAVSLLVVVLLIVIILLAVWAL